MNGNRIKKFYSLSNFDLDRIKELRSFSDFQILT